MEHQDNAPNEERTTEEPSGENDAASTEMDFQSAVGHWESQANATKSITLPVRDDNGEIVGETTWRYKMLTEEESREVENAGVNIETKRNKQHIETDSAAIKNALIEYGVVEGPPGFENREPQRKAIPDHIKEPLANAIDEFSEMPAEVREGF